MLSIFDCLLKVYTTKTRGSVVMYTPVWFCTVVQQQN